MNTPGIQRTAIRRREEGENVTGQEIREQTQKILSKQLELLAEESKKCRTEDLVHLTSAICLAAKELRNC